MVLENLIISVLTIAGGIVGGILFSKLGELLAAKILGSNAGLSMKISVPALVATALLFLVIFALIMLRMIVSVYRLKPVELLKRQERNLRRQTGSLQYSGCFCLVWLIIYP